MYFFGSNGLFIYLAFIGSLLTLFLIWRKTSVPATPQEDSFLVMPQTTPITAELDPRGDYDN